ncbi:hypothetical protein C3Y89_15675 [Rhizobium sp. UPM1132]|nr:hypothetical protein [Rhizobium ruizarguesonis]NKQ76665.1 hypothetical protein [Rhizobium ruizarguesonis]
MIVEVTAVAHFRPSKSPKPVAHSTGGAAMHTFRRKTQRHQKDLWPLAPCHAVMKREIILVGPQGGLSVRDADFQQQGHLRQHLMILLTRVKSLPLNNTHIGQHATGHWTFVHIPVQSINSRSLLFSVTCATLEKRSAPRVERSSDLRIK